MDEQELRILRAEVKKAERSVRLIKQLVARLIEEATEIDSPKGAHENDNSNRST